MGKRERANAQQKVIKLSNSFGHQNSRTIVKNITIVIKGRTKGIVLHKAVASRVDHLLGSIDL